MTINPLVSTTRRLRRGFSLAAPVSAVPSNGAVLAALAVLALVVRLSVVDPDTLHADEALYASYAHHIAATGDWLLLHVGFALDKMPVYFWAQGITVAIVGDSPLSIRLVDLLASLATVWAVYALARAGGGPIAGLVAGLFMSLSPFAVLYGATAFTDPLTVGLGTAGLVAAYRVRPATSGILLALAFGAKLFALAYIPLAFGLVMILARSRRRSAILRLSVALLLVAGLLIGIMVIRTVIFGAPWFLALQWEGVGGTAVLSPEQWQPRAVAWWAYAQYFVESLGMRLIAAAGLVGAVVAVIQAKRRRRYFITSLFAFCAAYVVLLLGFKSPVYDRYLLYLLPVVCIVIGIGVARLVRLVPRGSLRAAALVALLVVIVFRSIPVIIAAGIGAFPTGARADATFSGYRDVCGWLAARANGSQVVWNHSLSWHLGYCLEALPIYAYWYPDVSQISEQGSEMYLAMSALDDPDATIAALRARLWTVSGVHQTEIRGETRLWIYRLIPPTGDTGPAEPVSR